MAEWWPGEPQTIESYREAVENIRRFNEALERTSTDLKTQLRMFRHWYYAPELGMIGPSKFIGYRNMTAQGYSRGDNKHGAHSQEALKRFFRRAKPGAESALVTSKYEALMSANGKDNRAVFDLYVPREPLKKRPSS